MEQVCKACKETFRLTKAQQKLFETQQSHMQPVALSCPLCGRTSLIIFTASEKKPKRPQFRCPVSHCAGWVDYIEEKKARPFWGCGECGSRWGDIEKLYKEIAEIQGTYPYRSKCYKKVRSQWRPIPLEEQPEDYEEKVEKEPFDQRDDFVRG